MDLTLLDFEGGIIVRNDTSMRPPPLGHAFRALVWWENHPIATKAGGGRMLVYMPEPPFHTHYNMLKFLMQQFPSIRSLRTPLPEREHIDPILPSKATNMVYFGEGVYFVGEGDYALMKLFFGGEG